MNHTQKNRVVNATPELLTELDALQVFGGQTSTSIPQDTNGYCGCNVNNVSCLVTKTFGCK